GDKILFNSSDTKKTCGGPRARPSQELLGSAAMFRFSCATCGASVSAPEDCAGRSTRCPKCGQVVTVPQPSTRPAASSITSQKPAPRRAERPPRATKGSPPQQPGASGRSGQTAVTPPGPGKGVRVALLVGSLVIVFAVGVLTGYAIPRRQEANK